MHSEDDLKTVFIYPIYAVSIDPDLVVPHEPLVSKQRWVDTNKNLIAEIGLDEWLHRLLAILEGGYVPASDSEDDLRPEANGR